MRTARETATIHTMPSPEADELGVSVAVVARRLGVAPATLRTWSRRYGLGPDQHSAGTHRRYTGEDLARLELMRALTLRGVAPAQAAAAALAADVDPATAAALTDHAEPTGRTDGGALPQGGIDPQTRGLARAAQALDAPRVTAMLAAALARDGVAMAWESLIKPALVATGRRWSEGKVGVDVEHLLSECVLAALRDAARQQPEPVSSRVVLLACAPEEQHTLPLHAVAAALAERRVDTRVLGARVPTDALAEAMRRCGPGAVLLWSQLEQTGRAEQFGSLPRTRPAARLVAGGPGWSGPLPDQVTRVDSLPEAVSLLARAAG